MQLSAHQAHAARWVTLQTVWVHIAHLLTPCSLLSAVDCEAMDVLVLRTATVPAMLAGNTAHRRCRQFGGGISHILRVLRRRQWVEDFRYAVLVFYPTVHLSITQANTMPDCGQKEKF